MVTLPPTARPPRFRPAPTAPSPPALPAHDDRPYEDRADAGRRLARALLARGPWTTQGRPPVVLGLTRGGLPVAAEVAAALDAELGVVVTRRIVLPDESLPALGAVAAFGELDSAVENEPGVRAARARGWDRDVFADLEASARSDARRRSARSSACPPALRGRMVIVVDDTIVSGGTLRAAANVVRQAGPRGVVLASPVAHEPGAGAVRADGADLVCPRVDDRGDRVRSAYRRLEPVTDREVDSVLARCRPAE